MEFGAEEEEEEEDNLQRSEVKGEVFVMYIALVTVSLYDYRLRPTSAVLDCTLEQMEREWVLVVQRIKQERKKGSKLWRKKLAKKSTRERKKRRKMLVIQKDSRNLK